VRCDVKQFLPKNEWVKESALNLLNKNETVIVSSKNEEIDP